MQLLRVVAAVGVLCMGAAARAADSDVEAGVVANVSSAKAGEGFLVGLRLKTHEGWHVYWGRNSGDAGIATQVKWSVTPGWEVEPLEMPVPERFVGAGNLVSYGYSGEVMLLARLVPTKTAAAVSEVTVTADASWLCCQEACVPGSKKVSVTIRTGDASTPDHAEEFAKAEAMVPAAAAPEGVKVESKAVAGEKKGDAVVTFTAAGEAAAKGMTFYPASEKVEVTVWNSHVSFKGGVLEASPTVHMMASQKDPAHVPFLVSYEDKGERRGFFVNVDLSAASANK